MESDQDSKSLSRRRSMGVEPIWRLIRRFSVPAIVASTVGSTYQIINSIFVGRLGATALAAMAVTFPLVLSVGAITAATSMGVTSIIARSLGAQDDESADRVASMSITLGVIVSSAVVGILLPVLDPVLRVLGANEDVLPLAHSYMVIFVVFNAVAYFMLVLASIVRSEGNPVCASVVPIVSAIINVGLDPLFIFGPGRLPALGIRGAAVATVVSQALAVTFLVFWIMAGKTGFNFRLRYFLPRLRVVFDIYRVGAASLMRSMAQIVVMGVVNSTAASFGVVPLAVLGVLIRASRLNLMPLVGLGQGVTPIISYNFGAGSKPRVAETVRKMVLSGSAWVSVCWLAVMLFPTQVMSVFSGDASFIAEGATAIRLFAMAWFVLAFHVTPAFFFQGIGKGMPATLLTAAQNFVFIMVPVLTLPRLFGVTGIWVSFAIGDLLAAALGLAWMMVEFRRQGLSLLSRGKAASVQRERSE